MVPEAAQANVNCGQAIFASLTLTHDMVCPGTAIFVSASNVVLDLGGHTITGPPPGDGSVRGIHISSNRTGVTVRNGTVRQFDIGVGVNPGANNATVTRVNMDSNGLGLLVTTGTAGGRFLSNTITNTSRFSQIQMGGNNHLVQGNTLSTGEFTGIFLSGDSNRIEGNVIANPGRGGIFVGAFPSNPGPFRNNRIASNQLTGVSRIAPSSAISVNNGAGTVIEGNGATGRRSAPGVFVFASAGTVVSGNTLGNNNEGVLVRSTSSQTSVFGNIANGNNVGIRVEQEPTGTLVTGNITGSNTFDGIRALAPGTRLTANTANSNGNWGIFAVAGVIDGGGNKASGNGQPAQCTPNIVCT